MTTCYAHARPIHRPWLAASVALVASLLAPGVSHASRYSLSDDVWQLLVLPGDGAGRDIGALFGSALPMADYGETWTVFVPDGDGFSEPPANATIPTGTAFWMVQRTGRNVIVDVSLPPPDGRLDPACTSSAGCLSLPLSARADAVAWTALGVPLETETAVSDLRLIAPDGPCSEGCDLDEAAAAGLTGGSVWSQRGPSGEYREIDSGGSLKPWQGFWIPLRTGPSLIGEAKLVIPLGPADLAHCV